MSPRSIRRRLASVGSLALGALFIGAISPLPGGAQSTTGTTVTGVITGGATTDTVPLPHAVIEVVTGSRRATTADAQGNYRLANVPGGEALIRVVHSGHEALEVTVIVPSAGTLRLDLHLKGAPVELGEIHVAGTQGVRIGDPEGQRSDATPGAGTRELEAEALLSTSGMVEMGLAEAARRNSGNEPPDPDALLFMRGSTADLKLVLLDGAPIHTPFHLGGLLEPIQPRTIGRSRLFLGGAPARYNGGLSHILDIETRRPEPGTTSGQVSADLMGVSAVGEKGLGPVGVLASGRILHGLASSLFADGHQPYGYRDGLLRGDLDVGEGHVSITAFTNRESVNLDPLVGLEAQGLADGPSELLALASTDAAWANAILSARYEVPLGDWTLRTTAAGSRYEAQLPVGDSTLTILGGASSRGHLAVDLERPMSWGTAAAGLSYEAMTVRERADQIAGPALRLSTRTMEGRVAGAYVEASRNLSGVTLRGGLRGDAFRGGDRVYLSPRLSLLWPMSSSALFRLAVGRYSQLARRSDPAVSSDLGIQSPDFTEEPLLGIATATHLVASLDQRLTPALTVGVEGFVKSFDGLPEASGSRVNTSGMDLRIAREQGDARGWLGYTLSWFWSDTETGSGSALSNARFSGHHLLTAGLSGPFTRFMTGTVRLSYGSGLPFSSIPFGDEASAPDGLDSEPATAGGGLERTNEVPVPEESFLRLDLTVSGRWTLGEADGGWTVQPYLRILNALDRRDALFYYFEPWRSDTPEPLTDLPVLPILGVTLAF